MVVVVFGLFLDAERNGETSPFTLWLCERKHWSLVLVLFYVVGRGFLRSHIRNGLRQGSKPL